MATQPAGVAVSGVATQVYVPASVKPSAFISNVGGSTAYLGGAAVTTASGFALYPNQTINMPNYATGIWAVAAVSTLGTTTTLSAAVAAGTNAIFVPAGSGYAQGSQLQVGTGNAAETFTVSSVSGTGGTAVTLSSSTRWAHASGENVASLTASAGTSLNVLAGVR
jgi:hypothetical protein